MRVCRSKKRKNCCYMKLKFLVFLLLSPLLPGQVNPLCGVLQFSLLVVNAMIFGLWQAPSPVSKSSCVVS